jgi:hypothetical protein
MKRLAVNPLLMEMVETGSKLPQEHLEVMLQAMERLVNARWEAPLSAKRRRPDATKTQTIGNHSSPSNVDVSISPN